ncbi:Hypothetical predicted protein [Mytilus galloprovincialis]|uniref:Uncharacterized protein n=1 Tax=Mytilus galloprovincialis TaxID=29158 RepID=A0A8B6G0W4_MYTGA|nr:Hypothetical predicted protein [Mytilus galloprovincialis]
MVTHVDKVIEPKRADKHSDIISETIIQDKENLQKENEKSYEPDKITKSLKTQPETDKFNGLISSREKENITLKSAVQELRNESWLSAECWKSKMETQKSQIEQRKQTYEKSFKDLQIAIDTLQIQIQGKDNEITNIKMSLDDTTKTVEQKENEIVSLKLTMSQDNTNEFQEVRSRNKNNTKNDKRVLIIGTSNTQGIDPTKMS